MTKRPLAECIGWWPVEERSMMESRRNPRAMPQAASAQLPSSSGPRCVNAPAILPTTSNMQDPELAAEVSKSPVIPHIRVIPRQLEAFDLYPYCDRKVLVR